MAVEPDEQPRWRPDDQLIPAILAGSATVLTDLAPPDRAWVVAGMRRAGLTNEQIRLRLDCSIRKVKEIAADPMYAVCRLLQDESSHFADELRMVRDEHRLRGIALANAEQSAQRYKEQLLRVLDLSLKPDGDLETFRCGCPRTRYNTYIAPKTGKAGCRTHRKAATYRHRERTKDTMVAGVNPVTASR
jgi:hypothetical protein